MLVQLNHVTGGEITKFDLGPYRAIIVGQSNNCASSCLGFNIEIVQ